MYNHTKLRIAIIIAIIFCLCFLYVVISRAIPNETNVNRFIDARVDKILGDYEDLIIKDGYFHDQNNVRYKVVKDEN